MQTILKHCTAVISRVIFIGFGIQIVLGILWMCNAFTGLESFGEGIVCVGAMLLAGSGVIILKQTFVEHGKAWENLFCVLSVLTFPFVMQSVMNPDIRIVITAFLAVCCYNASTMFRKTKGVKTLLVMIMCWMIALFAVLGIGRLEKEWTPVSTRLTERVVWTSLNESYNGLPKKIRRPISAARIAESTYEAEGMRDVLVPYLLEKKGEEETQWLLSELRKIAWTNGKKQIVKEILWDAAGYTLSPVIVPLQLSGRAYMSYTGVNYRELILQNPKLGKLYTDYSCKWFVAAMILRVLIFLMELISRRGKGNPLKIKELFFAGVICLGLVVGHTLDGAGRMDYKNTLFVLCIWLVWMTGGVQREKE